MKSARPLKPSVALAKLQEQCARSEMCSHEVLVKLHKWAIPESVSLKILALLKRDRFIDDARFASAFVRDKVVFNRWGRSKIRMALASKHLDRDIINDAIEEIDEEEYSRALCEVLQAKCRSIDDITSF
ncbi:MAG: RecX family transcriptional regulator, partial [Muribaculaceae bacterium]|nr:RecX family transcriptional regulator [Muribaculaceae bacterium]